MPLPFSKFRWLFMFGNYWRVAGKKTKSVSTHELTCRLIPKKNLRCSFGVCKFSILISFPSKMDGKSSLSFSSTFWMKFDSFYKSSNSYKLTFTSVWSCMLIHMLKLVGVFRYGKNCYLDCRHVFFFWGGGVEKKKNRERGIWICDLRIDWAI